MGHFAELVICDLSETEDGITPHIEITLFRDSTFVSWQSEQIPSKGEWRGLAHQTIFLKKPGDVLDTNNYVAKNMITKIKSGIIRKSEKYEFAPHFENLSSRSLMHVVLPNLYIPSKDSFSEFIPHIKKKGKRVAITWPFESGLRTKFYFRKVSEREFNDFKAAGMDLDVKLDPELRETLRAKGGKMKEETKDFAASVTAKFINEYASS